MYFCWKFHLVFGKSVDQSKKMFAKFGDIALLNGGINQIIFRVLFFGFCRWFFGVFKSNFERTFLQSIFVFTFCYVPILLRIHIFWQSLLDGIMLKRKKRSFLFISLPWLQNKLLRSINKLRQGLWCTI